MQLLWYDFDIHHNPIAQFSTFYSTVYSKYQILTSLVLDNKKYPYVKNMIMAEYSFFCVFHC